MSTKPFKICIVGCGGIASTHLKAYKMIVRLQVIGAVDINPASLESITKEFAVRQCFVDITQMIETLGPDITIVLVPYFKHCMVVELIVGTGAYILCQKPMAGTIEEVDRMIAACGNEKSDAWHNKNYCYMKQFAKAT